MTRTCKCDTELGIRLEWEEVLCTDNLTEWVNPYMIPIDKYVAC